MGGLCTTVAMEMKFLCFRLDILLFSALKLVIKKRFSSLALSRTVRLLAIHETAVFDTSSEYYFIRITAVTT